MIGILRILTQGGHAHDQKLIARRNDAKRLKGSWLNCLDISIEFDVILDVNIHSFIAIRANTCIVQERLDLVKNNFEVAITLQPCPLFLLGSK